MAGVHGCVALCLVLGAELNNGTDNCITYTIACLRNLGSTSLGEKGAENVTRKNDNHDRQR